ncbi:MAG: mono/diheme cytochrome c family protein [Planctomycetota bacterium]|jgi:mono/diheme cytochrome c family protein
MRRPTLFVLVPACVAIGALSSFSGDEAQPVSTTTGIDPQDSDDQAGEHDEVLEEVARHVRAPHNINLFITEDDWVRAPGEEWYEKQGEKHPGRFTYDDSLFDGQGGWVDSTGEFELRYNEEEEEAFYWRFVSKEQLTAGRQDYVQFCASCHGFEGDGYGRSAQHLRPAPRNFLEASFKFAKVTQALPTDEALMRLIKRGLAGTPMLPWALSDIQLTDIIQYIKSLSLPETGWRDLFAEIGDVVESGDDPWIGREGDAITQGEKVYHSTASCYACHPGYVTNGTLATIRGDAEGTAYRENLSYPELKDSEYTVLGEKVKILPPDFTWHQARSGITPRDLFETIASGIRGTAMPQWKGALEDEDIWATAYYVNHLIVEYLGQPNKRSAFMNTLRDDQ